MRFRSVMVCLVVCLSAPIAIGGAATPAGAVGAGTVVTVPVAGRAGVPAVDTGTPVGAVVLNLTVTDVEGPSFATVWPTGTERPTASNVNMDSGDTVANLVLVPLGADGSVSVYQHAGPAELVVDVVGWFGGATGVQALPPARLLDTRVAPAAPLGSDQTVAVPVAGRQGVPATGVGAVVVNLTATGTTAPSFLTAWPTGAPRPDVSNLNPAPGRTVANLAVVPVGADGSISILNHAGRTDVVVDVLGWVPASGSGVALPVAQRAVDTRTGAPVGRDGTIRVPPPAAADHAQALLVNLTITNATEPTFLAASGTATSAVNTVPGRTTANMTVLPLGPGDGNLLVNHAGTVDVIVDVLGWFGDTSGFATITPTRLLDTRVARAFPVAAGVNAGYARDHHDYPATDVIAACGSVAVAPVTGEVLQVRIDDRYDRKVDNPALRGGRSISILGDDGVRYYGSHYQSIDTGIVPGVRVTAGQPIAVVGMSGDAAVSGVCHVHFGLSPNCPQVEWSVRRGVIWPWPYLDALRAGRNRSPAPEIANWLAAHPDACAQAAADPYAKDAA